jgi:hypothetical protein
MSQWPSISVKLFFKLYNITYEELVKQRNCSLPQLSAAFLLNLSIQRKKISSSASPLSIERRLLPVLKFSACSGRGLHGPGGGVKPGRRPRQVMVLYHEFSCVCVPRTAIF